MFEFYKKAISVSYNTAQLSRIGECATNCQSLSSIDFEELVRLYTIRVGDLVR